MKILLMGNPNVGKSVIFSRLTGVQVISSNYPGTTVGFTQGYTKVGEEMAQVIDVPGTNSLEASCEAEEVAVKMLQEGDVIIDVVDSTNLERGLFLTLQLLERRKPMLVALNIWDEAKHQGIEINLDSLQKLLGVQVIPTIAVTGEGIKELVEGIPKAAIPQEEPSTSAEKWQKIGKIISSVQNITHRHHTFLDRLHDVSIHPFSGMIMAVLIIAASFMMIRLLGEGLIGYVLEPLFEQLYKPLLMKLSEGLGGGGILHEVLVGKLLNGEIDFVQSFGLLSTGLFVPLGMVLPYVFSFYLVLGLLEDFGYLPRLAVLLDVFMHRLGLHGYAIIPSILALGCNVPGLLATRILESRRERFIACTLISIGIPCAALQAMIIGLVGQQGLRYVLIVYGTLFLVWILLGVIINRLIKGFAPELFIDIPPYRIPFASVVAKKLMLRIRQFLREAVPIVLAGVLVINLLYTLKVFDFLANLFSPVITGLLGLPKEAVAALAIGFLRKDVALGMLGPLGLSPKQLVVGSVVLAMFFPCIATFVILFRELGWKDLLKSTAIMILASISVGTILNWLWIS